MGDDATIWSRGGRDERGGHPMQYSAAFIVVWSEVAMPHRITAPGQLMRYDHIISIHGLSGRHSGQVWRECCRKQPRLSLCFEVQLPSNTPLTTHHADRPGTCIADDADDPF